LGSDFSLKSDSKKIMDGQLPNLDIDALRRKREMFVDKKSEYIHIMITPSSDKASKCNLNDLLEMNGMMKNVCRKFKTGIIQYLEDDKEPLQRELYNVLMSCQKTKRASMQGYTGNDKIMGNSKYMFAKNPKNFA